MMILALNGSPRKGGNTDLLIDQIFTGARKKGHICQKIYLYESKISPCVDCRHCKQGDFHCPIKDDMPQLMALMTKADTLLFGTPIYWYGPTAKMKLLIDRLRPLIATKGLAGKKGVIIVPSEEGASICGSIVKMFEMSFHYLGMVNRGAFLTTAYEKGEISQNSGEMQRALKFGYRL
ncbi:MAG: iron-sulfur flavoprotein [Promethearchaeota archaeon CR_4]|nr:MAG: iron-sulfur flavoprotein [Candidatus Lokiarchaeota archaeon CR_4]